RRGEFYFWRLAKKCVFTQPGSKSVLQRSQLNVRITPRKRTLARRRPRSEKCQEETYAVQQIAVESRNGTLWNIRTNSIKFQRKRIDYRPPPRDVAFEQLTKLLWV